VTAEPFSISLSVDDVEAILGAFSSVEGEFGPLTDTENVLVARLRALIDPPLTPAELAEVRAFSPAYSGTTSPTATLRRAWKALYLLEIHRDTPHPSFEEWRAALNDPEAV
jgi:hypothetical protein